MGKRILYRFNNLKIRSKLIVCMMLITAVSLIMTNMLSYHYFASTYKKDARDSAEYTVSTISSEMDNLFSLLMQQTTKFVVTTSMIQTMTDINQNNEKNYISNYLAIQDDLSTFINTSEYLSTVFMIGRNGEFFSSTTIGRRYADQYFFGWDISEVKGITVLSAMESPMGSSSKVIPIIIPVSRTDSSFMTIADNIEDATITLIILLNNSKIDDYFNKLNTNSDSLIYLANADGEAISNSSHSSLLSMSLDEGLIYNIASSDSFTELDYRTGKDIYYVTVHPLDFFDLRVTNVISQNELLSGLSSIQYFIIFSWIACTAMASIMALFISHFFTGPFRKLMLVIASIKNGNYKERYLHPYRDEIGDLSSSINTMYDTIQEQMLIIQQEEQAKYKAEMAVLSEQLNPHFLYNTLDCIQWEIMNQQSDTAVNMLSVLGDFLRIGLNYGTTMIPLVKEINHAKQYINIMNMRSNYHICFQYQEDPELNEYKIVKLLLQPLVENSIKHGFTNEQGKSVIASPTITLQVQPKQNQLILTLTDNGCGIDIEKAKAAISARDQAPPSSHVGLRNIYQRLLMHYGPEADMQFFSIPYIQNSIILILPYEETHNR